ncbi:glycosyltransferase family 4 protein [Chloroflexota bacterium]
MRILLVTDRYLPAIGGRERHVGELSRELIKRGHSVTICTTAYPNTPHYEEIDGTGVYRLSGFFSQIPFLYRDTTNRIPPPTQDWWLSREVKRIIEKIRPDVIHIHGWFVYSILPLKEIFQVPLIYTIHDYGLLCPKANLLRGDRACYEPYTYKCLTCALNHYGIMKSLFAYFSIKANRRRLKAIDRFIAVSSSVREIYLKHLEMEDRDIVVIHNFFEPDMSQELTKADSLPEDYILFVGRLAPDKGIDVLIEAYRKMGSKIKLVLIGTRQPPFKYEGSEDLILMENASRATVLKAYQKCRFAIFPSIWDEPLGTVTLEAMSSRKAIITSRLGGFTDVVLDKETGILVPPNDSKALAQAMSYLLENPEVAERMGRRGYEHWRQFFTADRVVPQIEALYQSLL